MKETKFIAGLDLGYANDFSAFVSLEATREHPEKQKVLVEQSCMGRTVTYQEIAHAKTRIEPTLKRTTLWQYEVRLCQRLTLKTPYPEVRKRMISYYSKPPLKNSILVPDYTGVGIDFVQQLRKDMRLSDLKPAANIRPVGITAGTRYTIDETFGGWRVAKKELVGTMCSVFADGRLTIYPNTPDADLLLKECRTFTARISPSGSEQFESWREKDHDDIVLALAIALWVGERGLKEFWIL